MSLFNKAENLLKEDYITVFGPRCGSAGERVLRDLCEEGGIMRRSHVPGDSHSTAHNEGVRSLVVHVLEMAYGSKGSILKLQEIETDNAQEMIE